MKQMMRSSMDDQHATESKQKSNDKEGNSLDSRFSLNSDRLLKTMTTD